MQVPLKPTQAWQAPFFPPPLSNTFIDTCRQYISVFRGLDLLPIDEGLSKVMQNDFVQMRKTDTSILADDFHVWLTVARFQAISFGEQSLTQERWKYTLEKEAERRHRLHHN